MLLISGSVNVLLLNLLFYSILFIELISGRIGEIITYSYNSGYHFQLARNFKLQSWNSYDKVSFILFKNYRIGGFPVLLIIALPWVVLSCKAITGKKEKGFMIGIRELKQFPPRPLLLILISAGDLLPIFLQQDWILNETSNKRFTGKILILGKWPSMYRIRFELQSKLSQELCIYS